MSDTQESAPTYGDLVRAAARDRFVKGQLSARIASLVQENLELVSIVQELQEQQQPQPLANGEVVPHPEVLSDVTS